METSITVRKGRSECTKNEEAIFSLQQVALLPASQVNVYSSRPLDLIKKQ